MLADITGYEFGKFVHVLAVVLAFGPTYGYAFFGAIAERHAPNAVPAVHRAILTCDRFLVTPMIIVLLLAGFYLVAEGDISMGESWVSVGLAAIIILFGLLHGFFGPQTRRALQLAERDLAAGGELSAEYSAVSRRIAMVGNVAGLIVAVTILFMIVKP